MSEKSPAPVEFKSKRPSLGALLIAGIPFVAMCFSVSLWDRVEPRILGWPFNLVWLIAWTLLTPLVLYCVFLIERPGSGRKPDAGRVEKPMEESP